MTAEEAVEVSNDIRGRPLEFIVFSDDWGEHPSSSQHLFRHVAREHSVIWVNTVGMRTPKLRASDLVKGWRKLSKMLAFHQRELQYDDRQLHLSVYQPFMLPYSGVVAAREFNSRSVRRTLRRAMRAGTGSDRTILVATVPNAGDYCAVVPDTTVVYYCVDDFTQWPGMDADTLRVMESKLIARADLLIAASDGLYKRLASYGKPIYLLTHGVDIELFSQRAAKEHACLNGIGMPRAGFFGLIDARLDQDLLAAVARRMPEMSFVLAGPVEAPVQRLSACSNIHFTNAIPYRELPGLIRGLDVLLIPYRSGSLGDSLSPLKLKEYLATGKPIVSTPIAEARAQTMYVTVASTVDEWVKELGRSISADPERRGRIIATPVNSESWSAKACEFLQVCAHAAHA